MTYATELQTYLTSLNRTIDNLGDLSAKVADFKDTVGQAEDVIEQYNEFRDDVNSLREYVDDQLSILKVTKQAGPLSSVSKLYEKVLKAVQPTLQKFDDALNDLDNKKDENDDDDEEDDEGDFINKLEDNLEKVETALGTAETSLNEQVVVLVEAEESVAEVLEALNHADFAAYDNLKEDVENQFAARNVVITPLSGQLNDVLERIDAALGLFSDAEFEGVQAGFGDVGKIADLMAKISTPLAIASAAIKPIEPLLDAAGVVVDALLGPVFDFLTKELGIDDLMDEVQEEIDKLLPDANFMQPLIDEAQAVLDDLREFLDNTFGISELQADITEGFFGVAAGFTVGAAALGPTGFGTNESERVDGDGGDDILDGKSGDDEIYGNDGNDIIIAGRGDDFAYGGDGEDMVFFNGNLNEYEFAREGGEDDGRIVVTHVRPPVGAQNEGTTTLDSIEHVVFRNISFTGEELENAIIGSSTLNGTADGELMFLNSQGTTNSDGQHVANGLDGDDRIIGSTEDDELNGGDGNDIFIPGFGDDELNGGDALADAGEDTYQVLSGGSNSPHRIDLIDGTAFGPEGTETLFGIENLIIQSAGDNFLKGDDGKNNIIGGDGDDIISGRAGKDTLNGGDGKDLIVAGAGVDNVSGGDGNDLIVAAQGDGGKAEYYNGGDGIDVLSYSGNYNVIREIRNIDVSISSYVREVLDELDAAEGYVKIFSGSGKIERYDADGNRIATDTAVGFEEFAGTENDDIIYGTPGTYEDPISVRGAGGDDLIYSGGARDVYGDDGDDTILATIASDGTKTSIYDGGGDWDVLDLTGLGEARWWFSLEGSISRSIRAFDIDYNGFMRSGGSSLGGANVYDIEEFILGDGDHLIDFTGTGSSQRVFHTGSGDDEMYLDGSNGWVEFNSGGGDDIAVMGISGVVYAGKGNDHISFDDTDATNEAHGQNGDDTVVLERFDGTADGGNGYDTLTFDLEDTSGNQYGWAIVDLAAGTATMVEKRNSSSFESEHVDARISNFERVIGTEFGDTIQGSDAEETFIGREGADVLKGFAGADVLIGGDGADTLEGGADGDRLHGGAGNDILDGGEGRDVADFAYAAQDGLDGEVTASNFGGIIVDLAAGTATGGAGTDTLISIEDVWGTFANDIINGDDNDNFLSGVRGSDVINGLGGDDVLIGGDGVSELNGGAGKDQIIVSLGELDIDGGNGRDVLTFGSEGGNITIDFADQSYSGKLKTKEAVWNDTGTSEHREFDGVLLSPEDVRQAQAVNADDSSDNSRSLPDPDDPEFETFRIKDETVKIESSGDFASIEEIEGGGASVKLLLSTELNVYDGTNSSNDMIDFSAQAVNIEYDMETGATNLGIAQNDDLTGIEGILGGVGDDVYQGDDTDNDLQGGEGDDTLEGRKGKDDLLGQKGADTLLGGSGADLLEGGKGKDTLKGGKADDTLKGGASGDTLNGGNGQDKIDGGSGSDKLEGGNGADTFVFKEGYGKDRIVDFKDDVDILNLKSWGFDSVDEALSYATRIDGDTVFDFGNGDILTVRDIGKNALSDDILV